MSVKKLLDEWKLSHLLPIFEEQKIDDVEILSHLDENEITCITKSVLGDKIRLKRGIQKLKMAQAREEDEHKQLLEQGGASSKKQIIAAHKGYTLTGALTADDGSIFDLAHQNTCDGSSSTNVDGNNISVLFIDNFDSEEASLDCLAGPSSSRPTTFGTSSPSIKSVGSEVASDGSTITIDSDIDSGLPDPVFEYKVKKFDMEAFLKNEFIGAALLNKSKVTRLSSVDRDKLSDIIVTHFLNVYKKMDHDTFRILSEQIEEVMPGERKSTYFIEPVKKKESIHNRSERAKGKLVEKYRNRLHLLRTIEHQASKKNESSDQVPDTDELPPAVKDSQIWLKNNEEPYEEVFRHWQISYPLRKIKGAMTIDEYIKQWPILETARATELISYDFEQLHSLEYVDIERNFNDLFTRMLQIKGHTLSPTDLTIKQFLDQEVSTDSKIAVQLYLLPSLSPPKGRQRLVSKKNWKPSTSECRDSLYVHIKTLGDIEKTKKDRVDTMFSKGLTVQPYIIILGPTLNNVTGSMVVVNNLEYKCTSVINALNFCFKLYQILDAQYPYESRHLWYLLQWCVYQYKTKSDPQIPNINEFL